MTRIRRLTYPLLKDVYAVAAEPAPTVQGRGAGKGLAIARWLVHGHSEKLPCFGWVNTTLANIKNSITGTYRAAHEKHAQRTLAEFEYRFNRRFDLAAMIPRLAYIALRTPPIADTSAAARQARRG